MVTRKPDLLWAFVGTRQVGNPAGAHGAAFAARLAKAGALADGRTVHELQELAALGIGDQQAWALAMNSPDFPKEKEGLAHRGGTERLDRSQDHSYRHGRLLCVGRTARRSATAQQACHRRLAG